jgi:hypothetical protein
MGQRARIDDAPTLSDAAIVISINCQDRLFERLALIGCGQFLLPRQSGYTPRQLNFPPIKGELNFPPISAATESPGSSSICNGRSSVRRFASIRAARGQAAVVGGAAATAFIGGKFSSPFIGGKFSLASVSPPPAVVEATPLIR